MKTENFSGNSTGFFSLGSVKQSGHYMRWMMCVVAASVLMMAGCEDGKDGSDGMNGLVSTVQEDAGENCANGGIRVMAGIDANGDGKLDAGEITSSQYICNGVNGQNGVDGAKGEDGAPGADGAAGADGADGVAGVDGSNATLQTDVFEGELGICTNGGVRIDVLIDGVVQEDQRQIICNGTIGQDGQNGENGEKGADGVNASLQTTAFEGEEGGCTNGGVKIEVLLNGEIQEGQTQYICNGVAGEKGDTGETGADGKTALVDVSTEVGENCPKDVGGVEFRIGLDLNADGTLDDEEVTSTQYICNGEKGADGQDGQNGNDGQDGNNGQDGTSVTVATASFTGAQGGCTNGGVKLTFTSGTTVTEKYVCNGVNGNDGANGSNGTNGTNGTNGHNSLINVTDYTGAQCISGKGIKIESGIDANNNGTLDASEVATTKYVCDGVDGNQTDPCAALASDPECTGGAAGGVMTCIEASVSTSTELVVCNAHTTCPGIMLYDVDATAAACVVSGATWDHSETWTGLPADGSYQNKKSFNSQDVSGLTWNYSGQAQTNFTNSDVKKGILMNKESTRYVELAVTDGIGKMEFVWGRGGASTTKSPKVKISTDGSTYTDVADTICNLQDMATTEAAPQTVTCTFNMSGAFYLHFTPQAETVCQVIIGEINWNDYQ